MDKNLSLLTKSVGHFPVFLPFYWKIYRDTRRHLATKVRKYMATEGGKQFLIKAAKDFLSSSQDIDKLTIFDYVVILYYKKLSYLPQISKIDRKRHLKNLKRKPNIKPRKAPKLTLVRSGESAASVRRKKLIIKPQRKRPFIHIIYTAMRG